MRQSELLSVDLIKVGSRARTVTDDGVAAIMESIKKQGLNTPIIVRKDASGQYHLIAGAHRLEAVKRMGKPKIEALVEIVADDDRARMIELSENLHRSELTELERAEHLAEWIRLSDKLAQVEPVSGGRGKTGGVRAAARELGIERTTAQRAIKIANLSPEAKETARDTGQEDNQSALLMAARHETPEEQVLALKDRVNQKEQETTDAEKSAQIAKKFREICRLSYPDDWADWCADSEEAKRVCDLARDKIIEMNDKDLADIIIQTVCDVHERECNNIYKKIREQQKAEQRAAKKNVSRIKTKAIDIEDHEPLAPAPEPIREEF